MPATSTQRLGHCTWLCWGWRAVGSELPGLHLYLHPKYESLQNLRTMDFCSHCPALLMYHIPAGDLGAGYPCWLPYLGTPKAAITFNPTERAGDATLLPTSHEIHFGQLWGGITCLLWAKEKCCLGKAQIALESHGVFWFSNETPALAWKEKILWCHRELLLFRISYWKKWEEFPFICYKITVLNTKAFPSVTPEHIFPFVKTLPVFSLSTEHSVYHVFQSAHTSIFVKVPWPKMACSQPQLLWTLSSGGYGQNHQYLDVQWEVMCKKLPQMLDQLLVIFFLMLCMSSNGV